MTAVLLLAPVACKRHKKPAVQTAASTDAPLSLPASSISAADPQAASRLIEGFYDIEQNSWRWTGKTFAVRLAAPPHAAENGAQLLMHLTVPDIVIQRLKTTTLTASIQGATLGSETYSQPGQYTFLHEVPANRLQSGEVRIDFALDKSIPPGNPDARELGIIVSDVGLTAK